MAFELNAALSAAASGLRAQTVRIRVSAENIANAHSTGDAPGSDPYRRKIPVFKSMFDSALGVETVKIRRAIQDKSDFDMKLDPSHPAANEQGYVKYPNVSTLIEMTDLREAHRAYEANLNVIEGSRSMMMSLVGLLKI